MGSPYDWIRALATQQRMASESEFPEDVQPDLSAYSDILKPVPAPQPEPGFYDSYLKPVVDPIAGLVNVGSAATGRLAGYLMPEAYERASQANLQGSDPGVMETLKLAPGAGQTAMEALLPGQRGPWGEVAKTAGGLAGDIATDPLTWATGGLGAARVLGGRALTGAAIAPKVAEAIGVAPDIGRVKAGVSAVARGLGSAPAGLAYAPEMVQGITEGGKQAYEEFQEGDYSSAAAGATQAAMLAGLGALMGYGIKGEAKFGRKLDEAAKPKPEPEVKELVLEEEPAPQGEPIEGTPEPPERVFVAPEKGPAEELPIVDPGPTPAAAPVTGSFKDFVESKGLTWPIRTSDPQYAEVKAEFDKAVAQPPLGRRGPVQTSTEAPPVQEQEGVKPTQAEPGGLADPPADDPFHHIYDAETQWIDGKNTLGHPSGYYGFYRKSKGSGLSQVGPFKTPDEAWEAMHEVDITTRPTEADMDAASHGQPIGGKIVTGGPTTGFDPNKVHSDGPFEIEMKLRSNDAPENNPFHVLADGRMVSMHDVDPGHYGPNFRDIPHNFWTLEDAKAYIEAAKADRTPERQAAYQAIKDKAKAQASRQLPPGPSSVQQRLLDSRNFRDWFHGSKVVDEKGAPAVVYHATMARDVRDSDVPDPTTGEYPAKVTPQDFDWFSSDVAESWGVHFGNTANQGESIIKRRSWRRGGIEGARTIPATLAIKHPLVLSRDYGFTSPADTAYGLRNAGIISDADTASVEQAWMDAFERAETGAWTHDRVERTANIAGFDELTRIIESKGYDGVRYPNEYEGVSGRKDNYAWIAFHPEQIKSAIANTGAYSPKDVRIQHQEPARPTRPAYKSPAFTQPQGRFRVERGGRKYYVVESATGERRGWFGTPEKAKLRAEQLEARAAAKEGKRPEAYSREDQDLEAQNRDAAAAVANIEKVAKSNAKFSFGNLRRMLSTKGETDTRGAKWIANAVSFDIEKQRWTSAVGKRISPDNPEADVAIVGMLNRAPFEVFQTVAVKNGKVVGHWAWTSGFPGAVSSADPEILKRMKILSEQFNKGEIDGFYDVHNHPGGEPAPSLADRKSTAWHADQDHGKGYLGSIVTDHTRYGHTPSKYASGITDMSQDTVRRQFVYQFNKKQMEVIGPDRLHGNVDSSPMLRESISRIVDNKYRLYQMNMIEKVASMARSSVAPDAVTLMFNSNDGVVRGVQSVPLSTYQNAEWMTRWLRQSANEVGGAEIVAFRPGDVASGFEEFKAASQKLIENGAVVDAVVGGVGEVRGKAVKRSATTMFGQDYTNDRLTAESLALESGQTKPTPREAAEGVARTLKPIPPPRTPKADVTEPFERGGPGIKGRPEGTGGRTDPNIGPNLPHMDEWPDELKGRVAEKFKAVNSELDRAEVMRMTPAKLNRMAMKLFESASMEEVAEKIRKANYPADIKSLRALVMAHSEFELDAAKARQAWIDGGKTAELKEAYDIANIKATGYGMLLADKKTEAARILKSLDVAMDGRLDPELKLMGRFMQALRDRGVSTKDIAALRQIYQDNPEAFPDALRKALNPKFRDKVLEFWKAGLVSGPATKLANLASNMAFRGMRDAENFLAAGIDWARVKVMGGQRERYFGEAAATWHGYSSEVGTALGDWIAGHAEILKLKPLKAKGFGIGKLGEAGSALDIDEKRARGLIGGKKGELIRYGFKSLEVDDALFKHLSASQEIWRRLYRESRRQGFAHKEAMRRTVVGAKEVADALHSGKIPGKYEAMLKEVEAMARKDTFQAPLEGLMRTVYRANIDHKALQIITPFVRTPANIMLETLRRTPLGLLPGTKLYGKLRDGIKSGKIDGDVAEDLSKVLMGTTIGAGLALLAYEGSISGGGPVQPRDRQVKEETGWRPYSVKIGKNWVSYHRIEPLSSILGMAADIAEGVRVGSTESLGKQAKRLTGSLMENLTNKTFLAGLEGLFTAMSDPIRYGEVFTKQLLGSAVPTVFASAARAIDPIVRKTDLGPSAIMARVPGLSQKLPARKTPTGEDLQRPGTGVERFASPFARSERKEGPSTYVAEEMERVGFVPAAPRDYMAPGGKRVPLTRQEVESLEKARLEATQALYRAIQDQSYKNLPDNPDDPEWRYGRRTKKDVLDRIYEQYLNRARARIKPDVMKRLRNPQVAQ